MLAKEDGRDTRDAIEGRQRKGRRDGTLVVIVLALVAIVAASSRGWIVIPHTFIPRHDEQARARVLATAGTSNPLFM